MKRLFMNGASLAVPLSMLLGCGSSQGMEAEKPAVAVEAMRVEPAVIQETLDVVGTLTPKFEASVTAEYQGTVAEVFVTEWVPVKKGTPLARIDSREAEASALAAEAVALQAEANSSRAAREYERALKLKEAGLMTQQGVEDAETQTKAAAAVLEASRAQLSVARTRREKAIIRSPLDGVVAMRAVSAGDYAGGDPIFRVVDNSLFDLKVTIPSARIHRVEKGQILTFTTESVPGRTFEGTVAFINPAVDPDSRTVKVIAEVTNPESLLKAGLFVKGRLLTAARSEVLQVPQVALQNWDVGNGRAEVYVVEGETARMKSIETGRVVGDFVEVVSGVDRGETVVTRGAFLLRDGDRILVASAEGEGA